MAQQIAVDGSAVIGAEGEDGAVEIAPGLAYLRTAIANLAFLGDVDRWILIDAGVTGSRAAIEDVAARRFGPRGRPAAILLTHGHFDHVGALADLAEAWDVEIWAHPAERPYLDGTRAYPPPDALAGGGLMSLLSPLFPRAPVDVGARLRDLPPDGALPFAPGWRWLATPGHTEGHVSFWHPERRILIAGDAVIATAQESAYAALTQAPELHGPPRYFTPDWVSAERSAAALAALEPELLLTGHGPALSGPAMRSALTALSARFREVAVPA
jgi:glyoxylase-like metal-dependent hydrolase (beta-lactamase superfamily II)